MTGYRPSDTSTVHNNRSVSSLTIATDDELPKNTHAPSMHARCSSNRVVSATLVTTALAVGLASASLVGGEPAFALSATSASLASSEETVPSAVDASTNTHYVSGKNNQTRVSVRDRNQTGAYKPHAVPIDIQPGDDKKYVAENSPVLKQIIFFSDQWFKYQKDRKFNRVSRVPDDWKLSVADAKKVERLVVPHEILPYDVRFGYGVPLGDTSDLKYFTHLKLVDFSRYKIDKPDEFMKNLPDSVEELSLHTNQDEDSHIGSTLMSNVAHLKNLKKLNLASMSLTNLDGIQSLTNLEDLDLSKNELTDIALLAKLTHLKTLNLDENKITDISALKGLSQLTTLNVSRNQLSNISPLAKLMSLSDLDLSSNKVSSVDALKDLSALKRLILDDNHIKDVSCLARFCKPDGLTTISAYGNSIADVSAISRAVTEKFTDENPEYHFYFQNQKLDFDIDPAKPELSAWGIKAADHTIQFSLGDTHPTRVDANPYRGEEEIAFTALNLPSGEFKPSWWQLLGIKPHTWSFSFGGTLTLYRYRPYLKTEEPLKLNYGSDYPGDDAFVNRVSIKGEDSFPKDGRIDKYIRPQDSAIDTFAPGLTKKWVRIGYQQKDSQSNTFVTKQEIYLPVPVYVKTMAETWNPRIATLKRKSGETLTIDALKNAVTDITPYNKYVPTSEELDNETYQQIQGKDVNVYAKVTQDGDIEKYVCAPPEFDWGSFKDREVSAREVGTTISVPFTMTFADQSTYSGKVEVKVEAHSSGSGTGTGTGGDTGSGTGTDSDTSGNDQTGSENGTTPDTSNSSSPDNAGDNGSNTLGGTNNGTEDAADNEGNGTDSNEGSDASNETSSSAQTSGAALVHAPAHRFARYADGSGSARAHGASAQISGGTSAGVPGGMSGSLDNSARDANGANGTQDTNTAQSATHALNGASSANNGNANKANTLKDTQASHKNGADSALQTLSHGWPYIAVGVVIVGAVIVLLRKRALLLMDKQHKSTK